MKKIRPYAKWIAAAAGLLAGGLRLWTLSVGLDDKGLHPAGHPGWIGYLVLSFVLIGLFFWLSRLEQTDACAVPSPIFSYIFQGIAALGMVLYCFARLGEGDGSFHVFQYIGLVSAAALLLGLYQKIKKQPVFFLTWALPCLYFALELFSLNRIFSGETQLLLYVPQIIAMAAAALSCYGLWGQSVGLDREKNRLFWQCCAGYLCIAASPGAHIMYACVGLWLLSAHAEAAPAAETSE